MCDREKGATKDVNAPALPIRLTLPGCRMSNLWGEGACRSRRLELSPCLPNRGRSGITPRTHSVCIHSTRSRRSDSPNASAPSPIRSAIWCRCSIFAGRGRWSPPLTPRLCVHSNRVAGERRPARVCHRECLKHGDRRSISFYFALPEP
jgi:hypothetical protein